MTFLPSTNRKIPTVFGILLVLILMGVVALSTSALQRAQKLFTSADVSISPTSVGTANITDRTIVVYWLTDKKVGGAIFYGQTRDLGAGVAIDDRDLGGK